MSEFQELIKKFDKCRDYVRDFFVYGFKSRDDFVIKSARTYDDERRRIESWLSEYVKQDYVTDKNKNISLQIDANLLETNPLYRVWKTKSFTDNDITLHFLLLDLLKTPHSINEITDALLDQYEVEIDPQMVRRKCKEYAKEGLLIESKQGKTVYYQIGLTFSDLCKDEKEETCAKDLLRALSFFHSFYPLGILGDTILDNQNAKNSIFRTKHNFLVHTLEDEILLALFDAHEQHYYVRMTSRSNKTETLRVEYGLPLHFFVSTKTGRRFVCVYHHKRFRCLRLDQIKSVERLTEKNAPAEQYENAIKEMERYPQLTETLERNQTSLWGVSFSGTADRDGAHNANMTTRLQTLQLTLFIQEKNEAYILERLKREGKHGTVTKIARNKFLYEITVFDVNEMKPFIRSFLGRIIDIKVLADNSRKSENHTFKKYFMEDLEKLYTYYDID